MEKVIKCKNLTKSKTVTFLSATLNLLLLQNFELNIGFFYEKFVEAKTG